MIQNLTHFVDVIRFIAMTGHYFMSGYFVQAFFREKVVKVIAEVDR